MTAGTFQQLVLSLSKLTGAGLITLALAACDPADTSDIAKTSDAFVNAASSPQAAACTGCHNPNANRDAPIPGLADRTPEEIAALMRQYRNDVEGTTVMHRIARGYDDDIIDIVANDLSLQEGF